MEAWYNCTIGWGYESVQCTKKRCINKYNQSRDWAKFADIHGNNWLPNISNALGKWHQISPYSRCLAKNQLSTCRYISEKQVKLCELLHVNGNSKTYNPKNAGNELYKVQSVLGHVRNNCILIDLRKTFYRSTVNSSKDKIQWICQMNPPKKCDFRNQVGF